MSRLKRSRRGMTWPYILALITALIIIIVLFGIPRQVSEAGESAALDIACQNSLAYAYAYKPIEIEGRDLIDKNDDPIHLRCQTKYDKTSKTKDKELAFEVAARLGNCKNIYKKYWNLFDLTKKSVCIVCSSIEMPKNDVKEFIPNLKELKPVAAPASNYLQYLFGKEDTSRIESDKASYYNIDTEGRLAIVFIAGDESRNHFMDLGNYGVGLVKYKNLNALNCYLLEGETELKVQQ
jgi:hypothetical protein